MSELGTVNFKVFNDNQIKGYSDRDQIKKETFFVRGWS